MAGNILSFSIVTIGGLVSYFHMIKKDIKGITSFKSYLIIVLIADCALYIPTLKSKSTMDVVIVSILSISSILLILFSFGFRKIETFSEAGEVKAEEDKETKKAGLKDISKKKNPLPPKK